MLPPLQPSYHQSPLPPRSEGSWVHQQSQPLPGPAQGADQPRNYAYPAHPPAPPQPLQPYPQGLVRHQQPPPPQPRPPPSKPPEDLLTSPFDPPLPAHAPPPPAPPIPPNPEKDAFLRTLSHTLTGQLHATLASHAAAAPPLAAQRAALRAAHARLLDEKRALERLAAPLAADAATLRGAMRDAEAVSARARADLHAEGGRGVPGVDAALVAPSVLGEQAYRLAAEVRAGRDARAVLGRALERGRVGADGWARGVRAVARDEFRAMWLLRKAAEGMGLRVGEEWG